MSLVTVGTEAVGLMENLKSIRQDLLTLLLDLVRSLYCNKMSIGGVVFSNAIVVYCISRVVQLVEQLLSIYYE